MRLEKNTNRRNFKAFSVKLIFAGCALFLLFSSSAFGKTLAEYKSNVTEAQNLTLQLLYPDEELTDSTAEYENFEKNALETIRKSIPPSEKIEWKNSSIETDNRWLAEKLDAYQKAAIASEEREQILNEISERLDAIGKKIAEIENPPISQRTKDEDKRKLSEILKREEFKKADDDDKSLFQRMYETVWAWFAELFPRPAIKPGQSISGFEQFRFILTMFLIVLVLVGICYLIYKFAPQFIRRYRTREKKEKGDRVILGETLSADQNASDLFSEAEKLAREGNLRGAIRKGYIALLCELSDRKIIGLSQHKTNRDYLRDVRGRGGELYQNMNGLTLNFERHWYGFKSADEKDWEEFKNDYKKAVSQ